MTHDLALEKPQVVKEQIDALATLHDALEQRVRRCERKPQRDTSPMIQSLVQEEAKS